MHGATIKIVTNCVRDVHMWNQKYLPDGSHVKAEKGRRHIAKLQILFIIHQSTARNMENIKSANVFLTTGMAKPING